MFVSDEKKCARNEKSPIRNCICEIEHQRLSSLKVNSTVLEIGCGGIKLIRDLVRSRGGIWFGLENKPGTIASHVGSVKKIPFDDNYFDVVISSQSIEHWYQSVTTFDEGLREIHRVLRMGGMFFLDFPVCLHGHYIFMLGNEKAINNLFASPSWIIEENEDWRKGYKPLLPHYTWKGKKTKYADEWFGQQLLKRKPKSAYIKALSVRKQNAVYYNIHSCKKQIIDKTIFMPLSFYKRFRMYIAWKMG